MNPLTKPRVPSLMELCEKEQILAPCIWDCRTAHAAELAGFKAILLSGGELAESVCGVPDIGLITADDLVQSAARISQYSVLPVIVDADDGFGDTPLAVYRLIKRLIEAGAKGCTLDDTTGIRGWNRWGSTYTKNHSEGKDDAKVLHQSSTRERFMAKIKAALKAAEGTDFVVIARTECKLESGLDEAILRCQMARELGALVELAPSEQIFDAPRHPYTEALLAAIPTTDIGENRKELQILEGDIPSPVNPPKGCKFHTRCKYCTEICEQVVPEWKEVSENHFVACHHVLPEKHQ